MSERYMLPEEMRYSTLDEREEFYRQEFDLEAVLEWFGGYLEGIVFAVIIGRHTGIEPEEYADDAKTTILIDKYNNLKDIREQILEFLPESVYYDRNVYAARAEGAGARLRPRS